MTHVARIAAFALVPSLLAVVGGFGAAPRAQLPKLDGTVTSLGDVDTASGTGVRDVADCLLPDQQSRARNTYSFALLDESVGFDNVLEELFPSPQVSAFAPIAVLEGSFALMEPPLHMAVPAGGSRRIIRGTGGLTLNFVNMGQPEQLPLQLANWPSAETRTFKPKTGSMQTPATLVGLADILPREGGAQNVPMSVRQVHVFLGTNTAGVAGYPEILVGCSTHFAPGTFAPADLAYAAQATRARLLRWNSTLKRFDDVSASAFPDWSDPQPWEKPTWGVASGDLNGDGRGDLVLSRYEFEFQGATASKLLLATSSVPRTYAWPTSWNPVGTIGTDVLLRDFDGDGHNDLVFANAYKNRQIPSMSSRNFVLWGAAATGSPPQPNFSAPQYLDDLADARDTVALDAGNVVPDGGETTLLDIVAGNHGVDGGPFVHDNAVVDSTFTSNPPAKTNADVLYVQVSPRVFVSHDLYGTGGNANLTTDVILADVTSPCRVDQTGVDTKWNFNPQMALMTGIDVGSPWNSSNPRDGRVDLLRVARGRTGTKLEWFLNDDVNALGGSFDTRVVGGTLQTFGASASMKDFYPSKTIGSTGGEYAARLLPLTHAVNAAQGHGCLSLAAGSGSFIGNYRPQWLANYLGLVSPDIAAFIQTAIIGDFVPDRPFDAQYTASDWPRPANASFDDTKGNPDLLVGMGYELSGVPNRLYPFCDWKQVLDVAGGTYSSPLMPGRGGMGSYSFTNGWHERTNKGYGISLLDVETDGDLDAVDAKRTGALLYVNTRDPAAGTGREGKFALEMSNLKWPTNESLHAQTLGFREDAVSGDFDGDGDHDVMVVGYGGIHDYDVGYARGERDEATNGESWGRAQVSTASDVDGMFCGTQLYENRTVVPSGQTASAGAFHWRSDRLEINGRRQGGHGGDRGIAADFDGDGDLDVIETLWGLLQPGGDNGYTPDSSDPVAAPSDWAFGMGTTGSANYGKITRHRALAFRYWVNSGDTTGTANLFQDLASTRILQSSGAGCGPDDRQGDTTSPGTTPLHRRTYKAVAVSDFDNDGYLDLCAAYEPLSSVAGNPANSGYNLWRGDTNGVLRDATTLLPAWNNPLPPQGTPPSSSHGVGGTQRSPFSITASDFDLDGDSDLFVTFAIASGPGAHPVLVENKLSGSGSGFLPRPFDYTGASHTGWVQGSLWQMNYPVTNSATGLQAINAVADSVLWIAPIDIDADSDADLLSLTQDNAHRFYENRVVATSGAGPYFLDASCDAPIDNLNPPPTVEMQAILTGMRVTAHNGALPVDFEVGDLDGDGNQDVFAEYDARPANVYINTGSETPEGDPRVTKVFPETGAAPGSKIRLYGVNLQQITRVRFVFDSTASDVEVSWVQTIPPPPNPPIKTIVPGRVIEVTVPTQSPSTAHYGLCGIQVIRDVFPGPDSSPVLRTSSFALIQP